MHALGGGCGLLGLWRSLDRRLGSIIVAVWRGCRGCLLQEMTADIGDGLVVCGALGSRGPIAHH